MHREKWTQPPVAALYVRDASTVIDTVGDPVAYLLN